MSSDDDSEMEWSPRQLFDKRKRIHISRSRSRSEEKQVVDLTDDEPESKDEAKAQVPKKRGRGKQKAPKKGSRGPRAKNWMLTIWFDKMDSKEAEDLEFYYNEDTMQYLCGQIEFAETTKRKHWQAYVQFKNQIFATALRKIFPGRKVHHDRAFGKATECVAYTKAANGETFSRSGKKKTGTRIDDSWIEFGSLRRKGQEEGLSIAADMIHEGATIKEIFEEVTPTAIRHAQGIRDVAEVIQSTDDEPEFGLDDFKDWSNLEIDDWEKTIVSLMGYLNLGVQKPQANFEAKMSIFGFKFVR